METWSYTSTGPSISGVSNRTPPTAETSIHGRFTLDARKTRPVSAWHHIFLRCHGTHNPWLDGSSSLEGGAVDCPAWCCESQWWDHWQQHLWTLGSRLCFVSVCRELSLGQRVRQCGEGCCERSGRSWRGPGFDLGGRQVVELWLSCFFWLCHFTSGEMRSWRSYSGRCCTCQRSSRLLGDNQRGKEGRWPHTDVHLHVFLYET